MAARQQPNLGDAVVSNSSNLEELIRAVLVATADRRAEALRVLHGETVASAGDPPTPAPQPYLTLTELAKHLGLSSCTLWRWQVPGHALGGRRRFRLSEVSAYLDSDQFKRRAAALRAERSFRPGLRQGEPRP